VNVTTKITTIGKMPHRLFINYTNGCLIHKDELTTEVYNVHTRNAVEK